MIARPLLLTSSMIVALVAAALIAVPAAASTQGDTVSSRVFAPPGSSGHPAPDGAGNPRATRANESGSPFRTTPTNIGVTSRDVTLSKMNAAATSSLSGNVTSTGSQSLSGITVTAYEYDSGSGAYVTDFATTTNSNGDYTLSVPQDVYLIEARDSAQVYATMDYNNQSPYYQPDFVQATPGMVGGLDFSMPVAAHIKGTVHGPSSADLSAGHVHAEVEVLDYSNGDPAWFATGDFWPVAADGSYDVGDLPPDDYRLVVIDDSATIYAPVPTASLTVAEGQTLQGVDVTLIPTVQGGFDSVAPARLLDTRSGLGAPAGAVASGGVVTLQVEGRGGVPATGVSSVALNVTVAGSSGAGYVTAYPDGTARPTASNLNFVPGQVVPNLVVVPVGADGMVDLYNGATGATQLIADVAGFSVSGTPTSPGAFGSLAPTRLLDTRIGVGAPTAPVAAGGVLSLDVAGHGGVPASGVSAVVLNVTVTSPSSFGYLTAYGDNTPRPTASNLNFIATQTVPNLVIAPVGDDGKVDFYNGSAGTVQIIADVAGYYLAGTPVGAGTFGSVAPSRLLDTRIGTGAPAAPLAAGGVLSLQVAGLGGVPATGVSSVVLNVTITAPSSYGYLTAYGDGESRPTASNLNFIAGQTVPNLVIAPVGADGKVDLYNGSAGTVQVIADVAGYYLKG